jgi:CheY-like chemotaxis protein
VVDSSLPPEKQRMLRTAQDAEAVFDGRKVLIADDDMRNVFALSSLLAGRNMTIVEAENGREALARLEEHPDTKIVLMDIMMPEMDGYQAIRAIRQDPRFRRLPVIALTAKAMKGDREACMAAGASDYISKPIDPERLLSLLRVWLYNA